MLLLGMQLLKLLPTVDMEVLDHFYKVHVKGLKRNGITCVSVLAACSHSRWINSGKHGKHYFASVKKIIRLC